MSAVNSSQQPQRASSAVDPQMDDDDAVSSVPSTLYARCTSSLSGSLHASRLRAAVEADVQFLQNGLAKLRLEEERAKADIEQLRNKTHDVGQSKMKHTQTSTMRKALRDQVDYGKRKEAALIALNKERQAKAVWASKQRIISDRRETVLSMRKQKEINECRIQILEEEKREDAIRKRETIRELRRSAKVKRELDHEDRREQSRQLHEGKIEQAIRDREEKELLATRSATHRGRGANDLPVEIIARGEAKSAAWLVLRRARWAPQSGPILRGKRVTCSERRWIQEPVSLPATRCSRCHRW